MPSYKHPLFFEKTIFGNRISRQTASGDDKIEEVRQVITEDPTVSIRKLSTEVGVSSGSVSNILHNKLKAHPYKPIYSQ